MADGRPPGFSNAGGVNGFTRHYRHLPDLDDCWNAAHQILEGAVERGLQRRDFEPVPNVGIDEKSFGRGHDYVSVMTDIDRS